MNAFVVVILGVLVLLASARDQREIRVPDGFICGSVAKWATDTHYIIICGDDGFHYPVKVSIEEYDYWMSGLMGSRWPR